MKLNVKQAAERAGVSESLLYQWCAEGRLVHYRLGGRGRRGRIRISPEDLDAFMETLKVGAAADAPPPAKPVRQQFQHLKL